MNTKTPIAATAQAIVVVGDRGIWPYWMYLVCSSRIWLRCSIVARIRAPMPSPIIIMHKMGADSLATLVRMADRLDLPKPK